MPKVTLDGKELSSCGILKDRVVRCKFTKANPKDVPVGDVVIEVDGRKSNAVPITRWTLPFSWSYQPKSNFQVDLSCVLALRTDVHDRRLHAGDTPERAPARYLEPDGEASSCFYEVSQGNLQGCTDAAGSGLIPYKKPDKTGSPSRHSST